MAGPNATLLFDSPENPLDKAAFARLNNKITYETNKKVPIFSCVPQDIKFPYIRIGEKYGYEWKAKNVYGESITYTVHAFSNYKGVDEINSIASQVKTQLSGNYLDLANAGFSHIITNMIGTNILEDEPGDPDVQHAIIKIEFKIFKN